MTFSDGHADVFIFKNTERIYYFIAYALAALLCVSVGFLIVFVGVRKEIRYIVELGNEVNKMHSGLENASFRVEGNDEISSLADAIESMRTDLIAKGQKEQFEVVTVEYAFNDYLSEMCNGLSAQGVSVEVWELSWPDQNVSISFDYIGRIINNIQSNIIKYADITKPVYLSTKSDGKNFHITIENTISDHAHKNASNGIGLKNINSMMKKMNGDFIVHLDKSTFKIELVIAMI